MSDSSTLLQKRKRLSRRDFLILLGAGAAGLFVGVRLGAPVIRLRLAEWVESSGGPPSDIEAAPDAWFEISPDNRVRLYLPKAEMGQGVHTGLAQIAADELEIDWEQLEVLHAPTDRLPDPVATSASTTISALYLPLREAAATLRELLRAEAARQWSLPASSLHIESGIITPQNDPSKRLTYGELFRQAPTWELPETPPALKSAEKLRYIGKTQPRVDLPAKLTGEAIYGFDVRLPGMLYGAVARPPTIAGRLKGASPGSAASVPGVVKVVLAEGFAGVVAESRLAAYQALSELTLEWEPGKAWQQSEIEAMVTVGQGNGVMIQKEGDPEGTLRASDRLVEAEYRTPMAYHAYLEPLAAVADVQPDRAVVYASTQAAVRLRGKIAEAIQLKEEQVIVQMVHLGGGLGRKIDELVAVDAARLSQAVGRPMQVGLTRPEDFQTGFVRPPTHHRLRAALDQDGRILAMEHLQASAEVAFPFLPGFLGSVMGADFGSWRGALIHYAIPHLQTVAWLARLPIATGWWRGLGLMANTFAIESFMDEAAAAAGIDPLEFRLMHLPDSPKGRRMGEALRSAAELAGWGAPLAPGRGHGLAVCLDVGTIIVEVAEVSVEGNRIQVHKVSAAADPGLAINPDGVIAQTEGGITMGISAALLEEVTVQDGILRPFNFDLYPLLRNQEAPEIAVVVINSGDTPSGMGEPPIGPISAAVANAIFSVTGKRLRRLPLRWE